MSAPVRESVSSLEAPPQGAIARPPSPYTGRVAGSTTGTLRTGLLARRRQGHARRNWRSRLRRVPRLLRLGPVERGRATPARSRVQPDAGPAVLAHRPPQPGRCHGPDPYTFAVPVFGGRNWTIVSALLLVLPAAALAWAVSQPGTSFGTLLLCAALAGLGGGNFASSMTNISFFFPEAEKGKALGLNAAAATSAPASSSWRAGHHRRRCRHAPRARWSGLHPARPAGGPARLARHGQPVPPKADYRPSPALLATATPGPSRSCTSARSAPSSGTPASSPPC